MTRQFAGAAIFAALFFLFASRAVQAQDITLTSRDGGFSVEGTLMTFDGEFYRVDTKYGELVLDGQGVVCSGPGCPDLDAYVADFTFSGATTMGRTLLPALLQTYAARRGLQVARNQRDDRNFTFVLTDAATGRTVARVGFRLTSTAEGFADMLADQADIVMALREVRDKEVALGRDAGLGDLSRAAQSRVVALDALVPAVARGNPVRAMSIEELVTILSGKQAEWPDTHGPINLHIPVTGSDPRAALEDNFLARLGLALAATTTRHDGDRALSDAVAADPLALGVVRWSELGNAVRVTLKGRCGMPLPATRQTIKTGDYPFTAPLLLYLPARRLPLFAREFLEFLTTSPAQRVIRHAGFVDRQREEIPLSAQGIRLSNAIANTGPDVPLEELRRMNAALQGYARLTTTFRFRGGSAELGPQSAGNTAALARALETGLYDDRELVFMGFSDGAGDWQVNRRISRQRAVAVRDAVRAAAIVADPARLKMRIAAFGEAMPMTCDDTEWGRAINRRVEVWLR